MSTATSATPRRRLDVVRRVLWLLVLLVVVVTVLVVVLDREESPRARAGESFELDTASDPEPAAVGDAIEVATPIGYYRFWVEAPRASFEDTPPEDEPAPAVEPGPEETFAPPEGGSFVRILVELDDTRLLRSVRTTPRPFDPPEVSLRVGGRNYPVTALDVVATTPIGPSSREGALVAVDGAPGELGRGDLELAVTTDGVTQVADLGPTPDDDVLDPGGAAGLYDLETVAVDARTELTDGAVACGRPTWTTGFRSIYEALTCAVSSQLRLPYVAGLGWAPQGQEYLVANLVLSDSGFARQRRTGVDYRLGSGDRVLSLDGDPALGTAAPPDVTVIRPPQPFDVRPVVFLVDEGSADHVLTVTARYVGVTDEAGVDPDPAITIGWRTELPPTTDGA